MYFLQCDPGHATSVLFESLYTRPPMIMLLGAACSSATRATAQTGELWNVLQVKTLITKWLWIRHFICRQFVNCQGFFKDIVLYSLTNIYECTL